MSVNNEVVISIYLHSLYVFHAFKGFPFQHLFPIQLVLCVVAIYISAYFMIIMQIMKISFYGPLGSVCLVKVERVQLVCFTTI